MIRSSQYAQLMPSICLVLCLYCSLVQCSLLGLSTMTGTLLPGLWVKGFTSQWCCTAMIVVLVKWSEKKFWCQAKICDDRNCYAVCFFFLSRGLSLISNLSLLSSSQTVTFLKGQPSHWRSLFQFVGEDFMEESDVTVYCCTVTVNEPDYAFCKSGCWMGNLWGSVTLNYLWQAQRGVTVFWAAFLKSCCWVPCTFWWLWGS